MKQCNIISMLVLSFCMAMSSCVAQSSEAVSAEKPQSRQIALVNAGALDSDALKNLLSFLEVNLHVQIRTLDKKPTKETDLLKLGASLTPLMTPDDACFIALVNSSNASSNESLVIAPDQHWAIINIAPLKPDDGNEETFTWRIERQVMRSAGYLFGVAHCPNLHCVHRSIYKISDLDSRGRNFSPPCLAQFLDDAARQGLNPILRRAKPWFKRKQSKNTPANEE